MLIKCYPGWKDETFIENFLKIFSLRSQWGNLDFILTAIWSSSPSEKSSCLQQALCLPKGRTQQRDSCQDFHPFLPGDLFRYYCSRMLVMQLCTAQVLGVERAYPMKSHRHISGTTCEVFKSLSLETATELSHGWYLSFSFYLHQCIP